MEILEWLKVILLGVVEGITEWLPISSTGHMILVNEFIKLDVSEAFWSVFQVVIQLGAIMAVVVLFWKKIFPFGKAEHVAKPMATKGLFALVDRDIMLMWVKIVVSCLPAAIVGLAFDEYFEALFYNYTSVALALIAFGVAFIVIEKKHKNTLAKVDNLKDLSFKLVLIIGLFQLIAAIFPGTSRSGATIVGALMFGVSRTVAAEFTFFLAIPVMFGASLLKLLKYGMAFSSLEITIMLVGTLTAFIVSALVIQFLMRYIKKHDFTVFGWYRILLGALVLAYGFFS